MGVSLVLAKVIICQVTYSNEQLATDTTDSSLTPTPNKSTKTKKTHWRLKRLVPQYLNDLNVSVFQMLTNALQRRIIALLMLTVSIRMAHTTAPVKQDILVMNSTVQVRLFNQIRILKFATINFTFIQSG